MKPNKLITALFNNPILNDFRLRNYIVNSPLYFMRQSNFTTPNFVQRLKDPNRQTIPNWEVPGQVATHKMSYGTIGFDNEDVNIVYPLVQEINGELHDFTDSKYKHGKWDAQNNALDNHDYLEFTDPYFADYFTKNYKQYYPDFSQYEKEENKRIY